MGNPGLNPGSRSRPGLSYCLARARFTPSSDYAIDKVQSVRNISLFISVFKLSSASFRELHVVTKQLRQKQRGTLDVFFLSGLNWENTPKLRDPLIVDTYQKAGDTDAVFFCSGNRANI